MFCCSGYLRFRHSTFIGENAPLILETDLVINLASVYSRLLCNFKTSLKSFKIKLVVLKFILASAQGSVVNRAKLTTRSVSRISGAFSPIKVEYLKCKSPEQQNRSKLVITRSTVNN